MRYRKAQILTLISSPNSSSHDVITAAHLTESEPRRMLELCKVIVVMLSLTTIHAAHLERLTVRLREKIPNVNPLKSFIFRRQNETIINHSLVVDRERASDSLGGQF